MKSNEPNRACWSRTLVISLTALVVLCLVSGVSQAQAPAASGLPFNLMLNGSAIVSNGNNGGVPVDKYSLTTVRFGVSDLLALFSSLSGVIYPKGARLVFDSGVGAVLVEDRYGNVVQDLTSDGYMSVSLDPAGMGTWSGQVNNNTGAQKFSGTYIAEIDLGNVTKATGITKESYSFTAPDRNGLQKVSDSFTTKAAIGLGVVNGSKAIISLTVTGSGKGSIANGKIVSTDPGNAAQ